MFLHYVLNEDSNSLLSKFFYCQLNNSLRGDWVITTIENLKLLQLNCYSFDEIKNLSKKSFKKIVNNAILKHSFEYLIHMKNKLSKIKNISYNKFTIQNYLTSNKLSVEQSRFIFLARSRMINVRSNYPTSFKHEQNYCQSCLNQTKPDSQQHLYLCDGTTNNTQLVNNQLNYEYLLSDDDFTKQYTVGLMLKQNYEIRTKQIQERRQNNNICQLPSDPDQRISCNQ